MQGHRIELKGLYKIFGPKAAITMARRGACGTDIREQTRSIVAVDNVTMAIAPGEIFVIMGLSGSGKSTLIRCINRLIEPSAGEILLDGVDIARQSQADLRMVRRHRISMVFQHFALLPHRTALENVEYGLAIRNHEKGDRRRRSLEALALVGLQEWADRYPADLSGGMKQRVGLARAFATDSDILLMDEPFSALDPLIRRELQDELLRLQSTLHKTIVFVTHDFQEALRLGNRVALMRQGAVVQVGTPLEIVFSPTDSYVAGFTRDVDRAQLLCAQDVMRPIDGSSPVPVNSVDLECRVSELYPKLAICDELAVVDAKGDAVGLVRSADIFHRLSSGWPMPSHRVQ